MNASWHNSSRTSKTRQNGGDVKRWKRIRNRMRERMRKMMKKMRPLLWRRKSAPCYHWRKSIPLVIANFLM
jgi:uncharacterized membrane protein (DUF106 family)